MQLTVRLHPNDNVVVARAPLHAGAALDGEAVGGEAVTARASIARGHEVATQAIAAGEAIRKYDQIIGLARTAIAPGEHVHVHNCRVGAFARDHAVGVDVRPTTLIEEAERATCKGFRRSSGKVGMRNYIAILSSVNCSATVYEFVARRFPAADLALYPQADGIVALTHSTGCGMADNGEGYDARSARSGATRDTRTLPASS